MKVLSIPILSHDASICILENGSISHYEVEERFSRKKHDEKFFNVLDNLKGEHFDRVIVTNPYIFVIPLEKLGERLEGISFDELVIKTGVHHVFHAYSGFYNSGFDEAICLSIDGTGAVFKNGDEEIESIYILKKDQKENKLYQRTRKFNEVEEGDTFSTHILKIDDKDLSVGEKFSKYSQFMGYNNLDGAGKIMGLAQYKNYKEKLQYPYNSKEELGDLAEVALNSDIKTVTIALNGANLVTLDYIAYKGGTNAAVNIMYDATSLYTALNMIRNSFQCEYIFEQPTSFDPELWFVKYLSSNGFPDWLIPNVENKTECENQHGWYYDDNKNPTKLTLCAKACEILAFDENFTLQLAFGCSAEDSVVK